MIKRNETIMKDRSKERADYALSSFLNAKRAENTNESTLSTYIMHIKYFYDVLEISPDDCLYDLNNSDMVFFKNIILSEKKDTTSATYCRSIRAYLYWLMDNGYIKNRFKITIPKAKKEVKKTYTNEELSVLLKDPRPCSATTYQSYVFINLAISTGLRLSSMLDLMLCHINLREGYIIVNTTKNRNGITRYLNKNMIAILREYIDKFELIETDYLFCGNEGQRINRRTMESQIERYNKKHGVEKTSIHLFRHTFSKNYIANGGTIHDLQKILDHANIQTTMDYLQDLGLDQKSSVEVFNPQQQFSKNTIKTGNRKRIIN